MQSSLTPYPTSPSPSATSSSSTTSAPAKSTRAEDQTHRRINQVVPSANEVGARNQPSGFLSMDGIDERAFSQFLRDRLDVYIHDYLVKRNLQASAKAFQAEGKVSTDPVAIDAPGGFLFEWWSVFWDIFIARTNEKHSDVAASYIEMQQD